MKLKMLAVVGAIWLAAACGSGGDDSSKNQHANELTIGHLVNGGQTPAFVADTEGFFKAHGLTVERKEFQDAPSMVSALQRGDIDAISSIPGPMQAAIQSGFPIAAFMQQEVSHSTAPDSGALMVPADSPIQTVADLEGKTVGGIGGRSYVLTADLFSILDKEGGDPDKVTMVDVPFPSHLDALRTKQVDAVLTVDPFTTSIQESGDGRVVSYFYVDSNPGQPLAVWWATKDWIKASSETVEAFQGAIEDAIDWLKKDESRARDTVAKFTKLDRKLLDKMPLNEWSYTVDQDAWDRQIDILVKYGALPKAQTVDEVWSDAIRKYVENK